MECVNLLSGTATEDWSTWTPMPSLAPVFRRQGESLGIDG